MTWRGQRRAAGCDRPRWEVSATPAGWADPSSYVPRTGLPCSDSLLGFGRKVVGSAFLARGGSRPDRPATTGHRGGVDRAGTTEAGGATETPSRDAVVVSSLAT